MKTAYICDGRAPCAGRMGCRFSAHPLRQCSHTTNPLYAVNGACAHPEDHPERFRRFGENDDGPLTYYEIVREDGLPDAGGEA